MIQYLTELILLLSVGFPISCTDQRLNTFWQRYNESSFVKKASHESNHVPPSLQTRVAS